MTPGQTVNKDVSAVNTGSVDAFVRMSIKDYIEMSKLDKKAITTTVASAKTYYLNAEGSSTLVEKTATVEDASAGNLTEPAAVSGETKLYSLRTFNNNVATLGANETKVELNAIEKLNPDGSKEANEVSTLMAGGRVMVAASVAVAPEKQLVRSGDDVNGATNGFTVIYQDATSKYIKDGTYYYATLDEDGLYVKGAAATPVESDLTVFSLARDYSGAGKYELAGDGLYIFQRTGDKNLNTNTSGPITYSGFIYDSGHFYALKTQNPGTAAPTTASSNSTAVIDGANIILETVGTGKVVKSISDVYALTKVSDIKNSANDKWTFAFYADDGSGKPAASAIAAGATQTKDINANAKYIKATFTPDGSTSPVVFWITLDTNWADNWTYVPGSTVGTGYSAVSGDTGNVGYFYYRTKLNSGDTSSKLIDSVTLDSSMTTENYLDLTYDLNVALDSVQVTKDENSNETDVAIPSDWAEHTIKKDAANTAYAPAGTVAKLSATVKGDSEVGTIDYITWGGTT